jgi:hypothetical protein
MANTITSLKRLVGRKYSEEGVQAELATCNFTAVALENDEIGVEVRRAARTRCPPQAALAQGHARRP